MKKTQLLIIAVLVAAATFLSVSTLHAQSAEKGVKGTNFLNAGVGIGTFGFLGTGGLPITASFEHGFSDNVSAGVYAGLVTRKFGTDVKYSYRVVGVRGSYHFNDVLNIANPNVDVYGGTSIYYRGYSVKGKDYDGTTYKSGTGVMSIAFHAGGRYMFANNIGAFAELGYGVSPLQLGATFKF